MPEEEEEEEEELSDSVVRRQETSGGSTLTERDGDVPLSLRPRFSFLSMFCKHNQLFVAWLLVAGCCCIVVEMLRKLCTEIRTLGGEK